MSQDFVVRDDLGFSAQLDQFASKLPSYSALFGLLAADITQVNNDAAYFRWTLGAMNQYRNRAQDWTTYKDLLRSSPTSTVLGAAPATPVLPATPTLVSPNIEGRFRMLVARLKSNANFTDAIGHDLDIMATSSDIDPSTMKPTLILSLAGGQPLIEWKKQGMDGIEIYKNANGDGYQFLIFDARPNHLDTSPLPAHRDTNIWKYKAIYRYKDERVGEWSEVASITVTGNI